ncbi:MULTISPECIES: thioredoxin domain-containing protein [unclassified Frigoribacterium]|uniref:thioredoxin domain-containing protein n=1 Tax=unclassified Frigoribacterium TaxID=2627005 RepID=UPI0006FAD648|nr:MULTISPECIES: thioredoxin domain-containing protein [unclassified Frigoribacterium]KQO84296.1 thioredoxin [Frigoribacterium sp. Leaf263]KQR66619.1 thioredoxin [Frigoribacterium sp. Leaf172]
MMLELYTSAFCGPCHAARAVVAEAAALVPGLRIDEADVAQRPDQAEARDVRSTPTIVVTRDDGSVAFRATGAPTLDKLLGALALAV